MSQMHKVGKVATTVRHNDKGALSVVYHHTEVVRREENRIILNTGGWKTYTTKTRMNQASNEFNLGFTVFQKDFKWFVSYKEQDIPFDGDKVILPT